MITVILAVLLFAGMPEQAMSQENVRWYSQSQVKQGQDVFEKNCIVCHNKNASGTTNWKTPDSDGKYPPPPLNGTAHAWHHRLSVLKKIINEGGGAFGGKMPGFKNRLSESEKESVIAYFQTFWSDEIYRMWEKNKHKMGS